MVVGIKKYGRQEAREHHVSQKMGEKIALDHVKEMGPKFYPAYNKWEKQFKKKNKIK